MYMDFIIEVFEKVKVNVCNVKGLEFIYELFVLCYFMVCLKEKV